MSEFYILSLRWTISNDQIATWWDHDNNGYVQNLAKAGRYSEERVRKLPDYYNNGVTTLAVPCELAARHAVTTVHTSALSAIATEVRGRRTNVVAPFEHGPECPTCGDEPALPGCSKLVELPLVTEQRGNYPARPVSSQLVEQLARLLSGGG